MDHLDRHILTNNKEDTTPQEYAKRWNVDVVSASGTKTLDRLNTEVLLLQTYNGKNTVCVHCVVMSPDLRPGGTRTALKKSHTYMRHMPTPHRDKHRDFSIRLRSTGQG